MKFLIVDDSRAAQAVIRRSIQNMGFEGAEIRTASSADEALKIYEEYKPDIFISDLRMPKLSGLELVKKVRELGYTKGFGFISGETGTLSVFEALEYANFFLGKPYKDEDLKSEIETIITDQNRYLRIVNPTAWAK